MFVECDYEEVVKERADTTVIHPSYEIKSGTETYYYLHYENSKAIIEKTNR